MNPASNHVLLTGGAGFIGSHVSEALLRRGVQLSVVDSLDDFYSPTAKRTNLEEVRKVEIFLSANSTSVTSTRFIKPSQSCGLTRLFTWQRKPGSGPRSRTHSSTSA